MWSKIFVVVTFVVIINVINTSGYVVPKRSYLYASQYPYGFETKYRGLNRQEEEEVKERTLINPFTKKSVIGNKPVVELNVKKDLADKIHTVNIDDFKQKIPGNKKSSLKNKIEEETAAKSVQPCVEKPKAEKVKVGDVVETIKNNEVVFPNVNIHLNQKAIKNKVKKYKDRINKKVNVKQMKQNMAVKFASVRKAENKYATKIKNINTCLLKTKAKTTLAKLKEKKANIRLKYNIIKTSPMTQIYLNSLKAKVPEIKCKTAHKLSELKAKVPKVTVKRTAPVLVTGGIVGHQVHHRRARAVKYDFDKIEKNLRRYIKSKKGVLKKKQLDAKIGAKKYTIKINKDKNIKNRLRSWKRSLN